MSERSTATLIIDSVGFRVPCRSFYIRANITRDRPLPVVDEFVLRLLRICGELKLRRLGDFFGFTKAESERVVADLVEKDLLICEGDALRLSAKASTLFRTSADEEPRLIEVEPWTENIWIDLVSRNFVQRPRQKPGRNLVDIPPDNQATDLPAEFARKAFDQNFRDYASRILRFNDPARLSVHSIAAVEPDRYGTVVMTGKKVLSSGERGPRLELDGAVEEAAQLQALAATLSSEYGRLDQPRAQATSIGDFERLTGIPLRHYVNAQQQFEIGRWLAEQQDFANPAIEWIIGASYLEANVRRIVTRLAECKPERIEREVLWLRPGGDSWGVTPDLPTALDAFRGAVGLPETPRTHGTTLLAPKMAQSATKRRMGRMFERGEVAPAKLAASTEILVVGKTVALVLVHVFIDKENTVPIGIATHHEKLVTRIHKQLSGEREPIWINRTKAAKENHATHAAGA